MGMIEIIQLPLSQKQKVKSGIVVVPMKGEKVFENMR